jgi:hypothetical protein
MERGQYASRRAAGVGATYIHSLRPGKAGQLPLAEGQGDPVTPAAVARPALVRSARVSRCVRKSVDRTTGLRPARRQKFAAASPYESLALLLRSRCECV